ncbi:hypothetical protein SGPA1_30795 [Streptomyces misionensis JCM 4497]
MGDAAEGTRLHRRRGNGLARPSREPHHGDAHRSGLYLNYPQPRPDTDSAGAALRLDQFPFGPAAGQLATSGVSFRSFPAPMPQSRRR